MFENDSVLDFDIDAIMEGTESTIDMIFDEEEAFDAECESTVISDDIDDMAIDNIIGLDGLITDDDIDAIDAGKSPVDANDPIDDDAEKGASDPEIFRLQKDLFQNTLLSEDDIKDLREGMSIEDFTARVMQEAEELPTIDTTQSTVRDECGTGGVCKECGCSPCICANHVDKDDDHKDKEEDDDDHKDKKDDDHDDDDHHGFDLEKEFSKVDDDKFDDDDFDDDDDDYEFDDEVNAPLNVPAGPIQPLNDGKENSNEIDDSTLPFAPGNDNGNNNISEDNEIEDSLSKLENEGEDDIMAKFTEEEMKMLETAYAEGYAKKLDEMEEAVQEGSEEEMDEFEAALVEAYEAGYNNAYAEATGDTGEVEEENEDMDSVVEEFSDVDEMLDSIQEGLEDIEIENEFEGSGINADQKDANAGMFTGWKDNKDEPGATTQNDTTLPFENVTVKSFADIEDDAKACMIK